ncbi:TonB-dependent receptor [Polyangium sp. 6x1]|uniref:TonB-dependent receptor domain-containing protein n=1 Tax=Polyangium sp. 6x1 TaxID=3042689 RepID=UPI002482E9B2|nr:TonB-dependent receptor [Polyangium sp. 6x1]MDI1448465.1 TonB-dependent receptor [Polyangium sp. 6x1]
MVFPFRIPGVAFLVGVFLATPVVLAEEPLPSGLGAGSGARFGESIDPAGVRLLPLMAPELRGGPARSFENLALLLPGTQEDLYGVSFVGASSPENTFFVDGIRVGNPVLGVLQMPLSMEFVERADVTVAGADVAFGRGMGGVYDVTTKSGGDRFHASTWGSLAPGALEGERPLRVFENTVIHTDPRLDGVRDLGGSVGGPIVKDRLFFFAGGSLARRRYRLDRSLNAMTWTPSDDFGDVFGAKPTLDPETGAQVKTRLAGTERTEFAQGDVGQWIGKLTYRHSKAQEVTLSVFGTYAGSGGGATYAFDPRSDAIGVDNLNGELTAMGRRETALTNAVVLRGTSLLGRDARLDTALGWVRSQTETRAADGSGVDDIGTPGTLAHVPRVLWNRPLDSVPPHPIDDFEDLPTSAYPVCSPPGAPILFALNCAAGPYSMGGPGLLSRFTADRIEGRAVVSLRARGLGEHKIRAGIDFEVATVSRVQGYSGAALVRESLGGSFVRNERFGYLAGPDAPVTYDSTTTRASSYGAGAFLADTWRIVDGFVIEASVRYDAQVFGAGTLALPFMIAPRAAVTWDPTKKGRARIFATYGMRYQSVPLDVSVRALAKETRLSSFHQTSGCRVNAPEDLYGGCGRESASVIVNPAQPSTLYSLQGGRNAVDPDTSAPASHQIVAGAEVLVPLGVRLGAVFVHDELIRALEDTSLSTGGFLIGNPGAGAAVFATEAERVYNGLSITVMRPFAGGFVGIASYTFSSLYGNYSGFFRQDTGQLDPNNTTDFDEPELDTNRTGLLPGDHTHSVKLYAGKEFVLPAGVILEAGAGYTGRSGTPYSMLGSHALFGDGEVFILPRGSAGRTPWVNRIDARLGVSAQLRKDLRLGASVEIYNLAGSQTETAVDQNYTYNDVQAIPDGTPDDVPEDLVENPRYGKPVAWQAPRQVRFGLRVDY